MMPMTTGFLRHIKDCNRHDLSGFRPFQVAGVAVGWVRPAFRDQLLTHGAPFVAVGDGVGLSDSLDNAAARTAAVQDALRHMVSAGTFRELRGEMYAVAPTWGATPLLELDRAAVPYFGVTAYGLHVNGFVRRADGIHLWVAKRAMDRGVAPGQYDNMVAGGQPAGLSLRDNLVKEAWEEAGLPSDLALQAQPVGCITYVMEQRKGLKPDVLFLYDLELPDPIVPHNMDGEVERFELWPLDQVARSVRDSDDWKFNVNLTIIDFLIRHGWITPEDPDYLAMCQGLHGAAYSR